MSSKRKYVVIGITTVSDGVAEVSSMQMDMGEIAAELVKRNSTIADGYQLMCGVVLHNLDAVLDLEVGMRLIYVQDDTDVIIKRIS